jgi:hypothetical protein
MNIANLEQHIHAVKQLAAHISDELTKKPEGFSSSDLEYVARSSRIEGCTSLAPAAVAYLLGKGRVRLVGDRWHAVASPTKESWIEATWAIALDTSCKTSGEAKVSALALLRPVVLSPMS